MKKAIYTSLFMLTLAIAYVALLLGVFNTFTSEVNTLYTESFSKTKFNQIEAGMTRIEVLTILGEPFSNEDWAMRYSKPKPSNQVIPPFAQDFWWIDAIVTFNKDGKVMGKALNRFFI